MAPIVGHLKRQVGAVGVCEACFVGWRCRFQSCIAAVRRAFFKAPSGRLRRRVAGLGLSLAAFLTPLGAAPRAGAFLMPEGNGQVIYQSSFEGARSSFDGRGHVIPSSAWSRASLSAAAEYGATDWLTLLAATSLDRYVDAQTSFLGLRGLGVTSLGARGPIFYATDWLMSAEASVRVPGAAIASWDQSIDRSRNVDLRLMAAYQFKVFDSDGFVETQAAARFALNPVPNAARRAGLLDVTLGVQPWASLQILLQSFGKVEPQVAGSAAISQKLQLSGVWRMSSGVSLQVGAFATLLARHAAFSRGLVSGLWYHF